MAGTSPVTTSARLARPRRCRREFQRNAVHAVAQPGRFGPVGEHVTKMTAAAMARHRGAEHAKGAILALVHRMLQWCPETWPAGAAFKFRFRRVERQVAAGAAERAGTMLVIERAGEWPLGALAAQHMILLGREQLAPLFVAMGNFVGAAFGGRRMRARQARDDERGRGGAGVKQISARIHASFSPGLISRRRASWSRHLDQTYCSAI